ncbi:MAG: hypothetical protein KIH10_17635, partial [Candidatus Freyarchaeota archaeon]|nr:hypothetical protein [Candidatus Jordarchaeia archaeon]
HRLEERRRLRAEPSRHGRRGGYCAGAVTKRFKRITYIKLLKSHKSAVIHTYIWRSATRIEVHQNLPYQAGNQKFFHMQATNKTRTAQTGKNIHVTPLFKFKNSANKFQKFLHKIFSSLRISENNNNIN